ncbi:hypothetical protein [Priestia flexa]|uniref:hypothetical protein n=1 Tax=Priestia flexa TaxID=86664 RepID=UPI00248F95DA|nr:hypothetical protein [Priestia flexa]
MYYQNFENIKTECLIDDKVSAIALQIFQRLKPSDILTTGVFSRKTGLDFDTAEQVLIKCVNYGILDVIFYVPCSEDDDHPPLEFYSLKEYIEASKNKDFYKCPFCDDNNFDFTQAVVAFRRPKKVREA